MNQKGENGKDAGVEQPRGNRPGGSVRSRFRYANRQRDAEEEVTPSNSGWDVAKLSAISKAGVNRPHYVNFSQVWSSVIDRWSFGKKNPPGKFAGAANDSRYQQDRRQRRVENNSSENYG